MPSQTFAVVERASGVARMDRAVEQALGRVFTRLLGLGLVTAARHGDRSDGGDDQERGRELERHDRPGENQLAYGFDGLPKRTLYRVRIPQTDIWPEYKGNPKDILELEIYEHWLEKT